MPMLLVYMSNTVRSHTIVNLIFKSLSIFNIVVAASRLALQSDSGVLHVEYVTVVFLLVVEATTAVSMAGISGYRVLVLEGLAARQRKKATQPTHLIVRRPTAACGGVDQS